MFYLYSYLEVLLRRQLLSESLVDMLSGVIITLIIYFMTSLFTGTSELSHYSPGKFIEIKLGRHNIRILNSNLES